MFEVIEEKEIQTRNIQETLNPKLSGFGVPIPNARPSGKTYKEIYKNHKRGLQICYERFKQDPLAGIIVNMTTYFVFGRGLTYNFKDDAYNKFMNSLWRKNAMPLKQKVIGIEGEIYGEVYIKLVVHTKDEGKWRKGEVELVLLDPTYVDVQVNEQNSNDVDFYVVKFKTEHTGMDFVKHYLPMDKFQIGKNSQKTEWKQKSDIFGNKIDLSENECVYSVRFNAVSNDTRGWSDLIRIIEWLDNYQEYLRDSAIINKLYRSPFFDIEIESEGDVDENGNDVAVSEAVNRYSNWEIGSNVVHNQKEKWTIREFQSKSVSDDGRRGLLLIVTAGVGFPEYMLSDGSNANLATARTQQLPAVKRFADKQDTYEFVFSEILEFKMRCASNYGLIKKPKDEDEFIATITFPPIVDSDDKIQTDTTLSELDAGVISRYTAREILGRDNEFELRQIGTELFNDVEKASIKNQAVELDDFNGAKTRLDMYMDNIEKQIGAISKKTTQRNEVINVND